jgi:ABC-type amino acid transport substrate-binding protein
VATDADIASGLSLSPSFVEFDNSYLVTADSPLRSVAEVDRKGTRVAAYDGSAVHAHLRTQLKQAEIKTSTRGAERVEWLRTGQVEAIADSVQTLRVEFAPRRRSLRPGRDAGHPDSAPSR